MSRSTASTDERRTEVVLPGIVEPSGLVVRSTPLDVVAAGAARLRMEATGVSFAEQQMRRGRYYDQPGFPFVLGYDVVGTVVAVGAGVDEALLGQRVAAITKVGAWASIVDVDANALLPVPEGLDPGDVETLVVNGVTAHQMLHDVARVRPAATIVVLGANGGVGSTIVQLAHRMGVRVLASAAVRHHERVAALGGEPVDSADPAASGAAHARLRALAPDGVDAVFDHVGGDGLARSFALLRRGGTLVSYGSASTRDDVGGSRGPILRLFARLAIWTVLPNGRRARFYDLWAGRRTRPQAYAAAQRAAFASVVSALADGTLAAQVAARIPLSEAPSALALAESRTVAGKVVIVPDAAPDA